MHVARRSWRRLFLAALACGTLGGWLPVWGATLLVYNLNDAGAGSLRQAVVNNNALGGSNTIVFSNVVSGTLTLLSGELLVSTDVNIVGPGPDVLTVSGNNASRIFNTANANVTVSGLTIANGLAGYGGGIQQQGASLTITACRVLSCTALTNGGGIAQLTGTLTLSSSTVSSNTVRYRGRGAGVFSGGPASFIRSTLAGNQGASTTGGAIDNQSGYNVLVESCTLVGNIAGPLNGGVGGGISFSGGSLSVSNSTIVANQALQGGGIYEGVGAVGIANSILAGNVSTDMTFRYSPDAYGQLASYGFNIVGDGTNFSQAGPPHALGDQVGTTAHPINPALGPLHDNGGPTWTMAPLPGSVAIDQGSTAATTDQRGLPRPYDNPAVPNGVGNAADIGAFEGTTRTLVVSNLNDVAAGSLRQAIASAADGDFTTISFAPGLTGMISLASELAINKNITISGPGANLLAVSGNFNTLVFDVVDGTAAISGLTISNGRNTGAPGAFEQNGGDARGGGIYNQAVLAITDCVLASNAVVGGLGGPTATGFAGGGGNARGGGIANIGTLGLTRCTLVGNTATGGQGGTASSGGSPGTGGQAYGGGIYNFGVLGITNCTIYGGSAIAGTGGGGTGSGSGGGIYNDLTNTLITSTIASNAATGSSFDFGGGIFDNGPSFIIRSSTIAGNRAGFGGGLNGSSTDLGNTLLADNSIIVGGAGPDCSSSFVSSDFNLVGNTSGTTISGTTTHNVLNQDPKLAPLQNAGGPTMTMPLLAGSPAIDAGSSFGLTTDQRGRRRPFNFPSIPNPGDGTDIGAFEVNPPTLNIAKSGNNALLSWSTNDSAYTLEFNTNLVSTTTWAPAGTPSVVGGQLVVTNSATGTSRVYRLRFP